MNEGRERPFVSVKFTPVGRTYTFLLPDLALDAEPAAPSTGAAAVRALFPGDSVVVNTVEGPGGRARSCARFPSLAARKRPAAELATRVVRKATRDDIVTRLKQQQREQEAQRICLMKIRERGLAMKLARVEQIFDGSRLIFYYTAEGRVDFRELVRDLAAHFRARIEMRQIGVRDEAKMLGGYGSCGRPLCCTTWLQSFEPISIKMAKQQKLSLNPSKLSGMCGRLKCCLRYELPNGKGVKHGGCADEGGCGSCDNPTGPGGGVRVVRERRLWQCMLADTDAASNDGRKPAESASPSAIRPASVRRSRGRRRPTRGSSTSAAGAVRARRATTSFDVGPRVGASGPGRLRCDRRGGRGRAAGPHRGDGHRADQQGSVRGGPCAVAGPHRAAGAPDRRPPGRDDVPRRRAARGARDGPHSARRGAARAHARRLEETIVLTARELPRFGWPAPRLALAGLNPHAGEHGLMGLEEDAVLVPAVEACRARGIDVDGPLPADTVFVRAMRGDFDAVIACYHDQGLIPVKLVAFGRAVNVTLGLPIVRTSVDHGTAFDIAGRGDRGSVEPGPRRAARRAAGGRARMIARLAAAAVVMLCMPCSDS